MSNDMTIDEMAAQDIAMVEQAIKDSKTYYCGSVHEARVKARELLDILLKKLGVQFTMTTDPRFVTNMLVNKRVTVEKRGHGDSRAGLYVYKGSEEDPHDELAGFISMPRTNIISGFFEVRSNIK